MKAITLFVAFLVAALFSTVATAQTTRFLNGERVIRELVPELNESAGVQAEALTHPIPGQFSESVLLVYPEGGMYHRPGQTVCLKSRNIGVAKNGAYNVGVSVGFLGQDGSRQEVPMVACPETASTLTLGYAEADLGGFEIPKGQPYGVYEVTTSFRSVTDLRHGGPAPITRRMLVVNVAGQVDRADAQIVIGSVGYVSFPDSPEKPLSASLPTRDIEYLRVHGRFPKGQTMSYFLGVPTWDGLAGIGVAGVISKDGVTVDIPSIKTEDSLSRGVLVLMSSDGFVAISGDTFIY